MENKDSLSCVGRNIRSIRRRRHISQAELATRMGMRPGPVNCIETGRNLPSARVLQKLARALDVSIDAFFHPAARITAPVEPGREYPASISSRDGRLDGTPVPYLTRETERDLVIPRITPARTADEYRALSDSMLRDTSVLADAFLALEDLCGATKTAELPLKLPFDRTETGIQEFCTRVRRLLGIGEAIIFDYLELFENAGLRVLFLPLPDGLESFSGHDIANGNAFFFIASGDRTAERQLFRLCYELGRLYVHAPERYYGHPPRSVGVDARGKPFDDDRTARRFAALFLMPESAVRATVRQIGIRPADWSFALLCRVKHRYGVSAEAMLYRLGELGLIRQRLLERVLLEIQQYYHASGHAEPDAGRRILSPNGRLGDLLFKALQRRGTRTEASAIAENLYALNLPGLTGEGAETKSASIPTKPILRDEPRPRPPAGSCILKRSEGSC